MHNRKLCPICNHKPVAVNYIKNGVTHYRTTCDGCNRAGVKKSKTIPSWARSGYKKKPHCERCGFKAKYPEQLSVFYVDGNLKNNNWVNLKTICLNCQQEVYKLRLPWKQGPLAPDF